MRALLIIFTLFTSWLANAQEIFPEGCEPIVVQHDKVNLSAKKPLVVMIHNLSNTELWITHPVQNPSAQAGWSSRLTAGKWSALVLAKKIKHFELTCIESKPGHEQQISCADVLAVCQWSEAQLPNHKSNLFWAGENMDRLPLKAYLERLGFILVASNKHGETSE